MDAIELTDFEFETIIGILDDEQRRTQRVRVDLVMELPLERAGATGQLDTSINYADVQAWILTLAQQGRWRLLESLVLAVARLLLAEPASCEPRAAIHAVEINVRKLEILDGAVPGVRVRRTRDWCELHEQEVGPGVVIGALGQTDVQGAWRIRMQAGARWDVPAGQAAHVLGGYGEVAQVGGGLRTIAHGDRVARAPQRSIVAGDDGLALLLVGDPAS